MTKKNCIILRPDSLLYKIFFFTNNGQNKLECFSFQVFQDRLIFAREADAPLGKAPANIRLAI